MVRYDKSGVKVSHLENRRFNVKRFAVLVSGTGTLLEALKAADLEISLVLADRQCRGLEIATKAGIPTALLARTFKPDFDRETYTSLVAMVLDGFEIDFVSMAGFMTILHPVIFLPHNNRCYEGRIINNHPSLLPLFKGEHAVRDALSSGAKVTGCTIHIATKELDEGPILAQEEVSVLPFDTEAILHERIKRVERRLLPTTIRKFAETLE
ncbi:MAG: phosphoribosylglycinamide formyltransferase [Candidatus Staskawiczbacteria bacterium]|nr:phosphoribosylglycinamide formyltransferase [Candidatus Staskawiczbacteria bacterium]